MHTVHAKLYLVVVLGADRFYPYMSGLVHWHRVDPTSTDALCTCHKMSMNFKAISHGFIKRDIKADAMSYKISVLFICCPIQYPLLHWHVIMYVSQNVDEFQSDKPWFE